MAFIQTVAFFAFLALVIYSATKVSGFFIDKLAARIVDGNNLTALASETRKKRKDAAKK